jgi:hypothetical protein
MYPRCCDDCGGCSFKELTTDAHGDTDWECRDCGEHCTTDGDPCEAALYMRYHEIPAAYEEA